MKNYGTDTVIYTKATCPYCIEAKRVLTERGIKYTEILIDGVSVTKQDMMNDLGRSDLTTVPQIVLQGQFIPGGCTGLKKHLGLA